MGDVRYARSGTVHIAYAVVGDGPIDVVYLPGFVSNVEFHAARRAPHRGVRGHGRRRRRLRPPLRRPRPPELKGAPGKWSLFSVA